MQTPVKDWIAERISHHGVDGETILRWPNRDHNIQEAPVDYVVERFGPTIEAALAADEDVVEAIQSGEFDDAWKDIWLLWREYGWV